MKNQFRIEDDSIYLRQVPRSRSILLRAQGCVMSTDNPIIDAPSKATDTHQYSPHIRAIDHILNLAKIQVIFSYQVIHLGHDKTIGAYPNEIREDTYVFILAQLQLANHTITSKSMTL